MNIWIRLEVELKEESSSFSFRFSLRPFFLCVGVVFGGGTERRSRAQSIAVSGYFKKHSALWPSLPLHVSPLSLFLAKKYKHKNTLCQKTTRHNGSFFFGFFFWRNFCSRDFSIALSEAEQKRIIPNWTWAVKQVSCGLIFNFHLDLVEHTFFNAVVAMETHYVRAVFFFVFQSQDWSWEWCQMRKKVW